MIFLKGFGWCFHSILDSTDVKPLIVDCSCVLWFISEYSGKTVHTSVQMGVFYVYVTFFIKTKKGMELSWSGLLTASWYGHIKGEE